MKIAISFSGQLYGASPNRGGKIIPKDFRHTWPSIQLNLIEPFRQQGHEVELYFSCYPFDNQTICDEFYSLVKPNKVIFNDFSNSDAYTCRFSAFDNLRDNIDFVIFTRPDIFINRKLANENINVDKFNFLFPEGRGEIWWNTLRFTNDVIYMWPHRLTPIVERSIKGCYRWPIQRHTDMHGLWLKLIQYIPETELHFISRFPEPSDVNSFYTVNRNDIILEPLINRETLYLYHKDTPTKIKTYNEHLQLVESIYK